MKMRVSVIDEKEEKEATFAIDNLFEYTDKEESKLSMLKKKASSIKLRDPYSYAEEKKTVTLRVQYAEEHGKKRWAIYYTMANDPAAVLQPPYYVPKDNIPFLEKGVEAGLISPGKPIRVTMEKMNKLWRWVEIEAIE